MATKYEQKMDTEKRRLDESLDRGDITSGDYDAITEYIAFAQGVGETSTARNHLVSLRKTAERSDTPLVELDLRSLLKLLKNFQAGTHPDVKDGGIVVLNYVSALRKFYRYHDDLGVPDDEIEIEEDYNGRELRPEDLLYKDEVDALFQAAQRRNVRDLAFIALVLATGQREDAVRTLRMKHVAYDGPTMEITLNTEEGALKGAHGSRPLLWAKHYVRPWYESHPHKDNPEAALFPPANSDKNQYTAGEEWEFDETEPMKSSSVRSMVKRRAKEAGLEKSVYPHLLRHCAITRMAMQERLSDQQIKDIVGWSADSSQFATYVTVAQQLSSDSVREAMGLPTSKTGAPVVGRPSLERCPNCGDRLPEGDERCVTCQTPLTHGAAQEEPLEGPVEQGVREHYREAEDMDTVEKIQMLDELLDDPDVRAKLQDMLGD